MILGYYAGRNAARIGHHVGPFVEQYREVFSLVALGAAILLIVVLWLRARKKSPKPAPEVVSQDQP